MELPDERGIPDLPDWELLSTLFADAGPYRHRMGLRRARAEDFYAATPAGTAIRREKQAIIEREGGRRRVTTPEGHRAAVEFSHALGLFAADADALDEKGRGRFNRELSLLLEPDLLFVQPPDWALAWANVCFPSRWSLEGKAGRPLAWIHDAVPGLNDELGSKIATFFSRLAPGDGWRRANWGLSASAVRDQHPLKPIPAMTSETRLDQIFLRVEDQHLLKLPGTGAIAFGIRIASFACADLRKDATIVAALVEKLRTTPADVAHYKGIGEFISRLDQ